CFGMIGALLGNLAGAVVPAACSGLMLRGFGRRVAIEPGLRWRACRFAFNTWLAMLVSMIVWSRSEVFFLERYWGVHEVALFTVALTMAVAVQQVAQLFSGVFLPHFSGLAGAGRQALMQRHYAMATKFMALMVFPLSLGGAAVCPALVPILFGPTFAVTIPNAMVLTVTAALSFSLIGSALIYAKERSGFIAIGGGAGALLSIAASLLVIPQHGVWGAVWCRLLIQSSMIGITLWFITRRLHVAFPFRALGRMLLAAGLCAVAAWCVIRVVPQPLVALGMAVPLGAAIYALGVRMFHALDADEAFQLSRLADRLPVDCRRWILALVHWMAFTS
ncbi:MAG: polysaccharide biosynthesis C-terminal domain-containing protein, partial [Thermoguttaceae bacterium]